MKGNHSPLWAIFVSLSCLMFAGCNGSQPTFAPAPTFPATDTPEPPTPTPTPAKILPDEWDVIMLGDSSLMGVGKYYSAYIQEDMDVTVRLHDLWQGTLSAKTLLSKLQQDEELRDLVRDAEVVVYFGNPIGTATGDWACVPVARYVNDCSPETFTDYQATLEAVVAEVLALRQGTPTIIRATDFYVPVLSQWRAAGLEEECTQCLENMIDAVHRAAAAHNVPVAQVYNAFNGLEHDQDPVEMGYIGSDGIHTSDEGKQVIASLLRALGYEPVSP